MILDTNCKGPRAETRGPEIGGGLGAHRRWTLTTGLSNPNAIAAGSGFTTTKRTFHWLLGRRLAICK